MKGVKFQTLHHLVWVPLLQQDHMLLSQLRGSSTQIQDFRTSSQDQAFCGPPFSETPLFCPTQ